MKSWVDLKAEILENFDFSKVRKVMKTLDWKWERNGIKAVPKKKELRQQATALMDRLIYDLSQDLTLSEKSVATGGFRVQGWYEEGIPNLSLAFEVDEW